MYCESCKASFVTEANLKRHKETNHGEENTSLAQYLCPAPGCKCVFSSEDILAAHQVSHLDGAVTDAQKVCLL